METKIASLECDLQKLNISPNEVHMTAEESYGDILAEITDQTLRKKNIIITGIPEPQTTDFETDRKKIKLSPEPIKMIRIGKYKANENRPIKACFESEHTTKIILRNRNKMKNDAIRIFSDQTPFQQARFQKLRDELKRRTTNGEDSLRIKLKQTIQYCKVKKTKILNPPKQDLLNKSITHKINQKNILWKQHKSNPKDEEIEKKFVKERKSVSEEIQTMKSNYYYKRFSECNKKPKKMWDLIDSLTNNKIS
ncbi:unnamed protein product [Leptidea sinapis]|uniref:Uncharacterized protein n=1 Tax=Leptidea sinapis TaxID=189913 RepID=A0A5E4QAQ4_9NEOP|nr:unnamed protein product [Leptidea sinapis]